MRKLYTFQGATHIVYGGIAGILQYRDANLNTVHTIGSHGDAIKNIDYLPSKTAIVTGSWDKTIKIWDLRQKESVATYEQCDGKVYSMSVEDEKIAVGTSGSKALIWDLRNMKSYLILHRLNHRVNCIALSPNKQCYAIGHCDGRVAVSYIDKDPEIRRLKTTFRCHRMIVDDDEHVFGVTAVRFYNVNGIFATGIHQSVEDVNISSRLSIQTTYLLGGGNGFINVWDAVNQRHLYRYPRQEMAITSMAISPDYKKLAVACSEQSLDASQYRPLEVIIKVRYINERKIKRKIENSENSENSESSF